MPLSSLDEVERLLLRLKLAPAEEVKRCRQTLPPGATVDDFINLLERWQLITGLQAERLRSGETDDLVIGGYKLQYKNASGSFARVYRVASIETGQQIGMKVLRERWSSDPDTVRLFHREGELGKRLKHPNIVPIYDVGTDGRRHFITMEFVEGGNMKDFLKIRRKIAAGEACRYAADMARALEYAIRQGVTHRDLKLTNVLMSSTGMAKLIDFGLATEDSVLHKVGGQEMAQALEYSTLEKGSSAPRNDPRSDLYFLGTILYELVSGNAPYARTRDRDERKNFARYRDVRPIATIEPGLDWKVAAIIDRLLQVNPAMRFQTATDVAQELEQAARGLGEKVGPASLSTGSSRNGNGAASSGPTILCVEDRPKMQDALRNYFSKHGFRVLLLTDFDRVLNRLKTSPPDCIVLFGDMGDRAVDVFRDAMRMPSCPAKLVLVLNRKQVGLTTDLDVNQTCGAVLPQPVQLRDLRNAVSTLLGRTVDQNGD